jgi:DNA-binding winged helix-turn-helix (wHTH) protein
MAGESARIGLIGGSPLDRVSLETWCAVNSATCTARPLHSTPDRAWLESLDLLVVAADDRPLLALAECARVTSLHPEPAVALLGDSGPELSRAVERLQGVRLLSRTESGEIPWGQLVQALGPAGAGRSHVTVRRGLAAIHERVTLDRDARTLYVAGREQRLSSAKFELLCYLLDNAGRAISAAELVRRRLLLPSQARRYRGLVQELRASLGPARDCIVAVPGYGYRWVGGLSHTAETSRAERRR